MHFLVHTKENGDCSQWFRKDSCKFMYCVLEIVKNSLVSFQFTHPIVCFYSRYMCKPNGLQRHERKLRGHQL